MSVELFHPVVRDWFFSKFQGETEAESRGWPVIAKGSDALISAPTGSGKTLSAFLFAIDRLFVAAIEERLPDTTRVLYVSPLKALSNDIEKNLAQPLSEIWTLARSRGLAPQEVRLGLRTGDTPAAARAKMVKRPPHILVSTPESLYLLLTAQKSRDFLTSVDTVIVDEIHATAKDRRGAHLALSLERLDALVSFAGRPAPVRIGLSATCRPLPRIGRLLVGEKRSLPEMVEVPLKKTLDLAIELADDELTALASEEMMGRIYDRIAVLVRQHQSTIVFVNTRRLAERVSFQLEQRLGDKAALAHHGSLSEDRRRIAEDRLKKGEIPCIVATASLELGIDVGAVELVVQLGSPRSISALVQRVGRSGHAVGKVPKGRLFPLTRDQLLECAALIRSWRADRLESIEVPDAPVDILAQQLVAEVAAAGMWSLDGLFDLVRAAHPYRDLPRETFNRVIDLLSNGIATDRGRAAAHLHLDAVHGRIRPRRGARIAALTSGGSIPDSTNYAVIAEPDGARVGTIDEDFAIESMVGDVFLLGNTSWKVRRLESDRVRVEDARGAYPTIPFWRGEAPARTNELSAAVSELRQELSDRLLDSQPTGESPSDAAQNGGGRTPSARADTVAWLAKECALDRGAAGQLVDYLQAGRDQLGAVPTQKRVIAERFFDDAGGMQLCIHAPFGARINKAWGLALRKRFCATFDFELQAAATDDGILLSLGPMHSFPLDLVFGFLNEQQLTPLLSQAVLVTPIFNARWRWNATRSLAVLRNRGGKRLPPAILRMLTDDLLSAVFPAKTACQENGTGPIEIPDHPLVDQALKDCLFEALDVEGLKLVLRAIEAQEIEVRCVDVAEASLLSHELIHANPYAFLDGAPLEERRVRAVSTRRGLPVEARSLTFLDPAAIRSVEEEAAPPLRSKEELHDALLSLIFWPVAPAQSGLVQWQSELFADGRVAIIRSGQMTAYATIEKLAVIAAALPNAFVRTREGECIAEQLSEQLRANVSREILQDPLIPIVRGHLLHRGPVRAAELAGELGFERSAVEGALLALEAEGTLVRGRFRPAAPEDEWCERTLLARIHRRTLNKLRAEIEPAERRHFLRFLFRWQHLGSARLAGVEGLSAVLDQLAGFEIPACSWERSILTARIKDYDPTHLDRLTYSGERIFCRRGRRSSETPSLPTRSVPLAILSRSSITWQLLPPDEEPPVLTPTANTVLSTLEVDGALFAREIAAKRSLSAFEVDEALRELLGAGLVTADGFSVARRLTQAQHRAPPPHTPEGRWSLLRRGLVFSPDPEATARQLLHRYGVVFRDLLLREELGLPWPVLLYELRRLEARQEIRGGRFVAGIAGEQFALPEALETLRALRKRPSENEWVEIAATDPLNLVGIATPGAKVPAHPDNRVLFLDGVPVASQVAGRFFSLATLSPEITARAPGGFAGAFAPDLERVEREPASAQEF